MKITFDKSKILKRFSDSYSRKLDEGLETTLTFIDERTPIRTGALISHNKIRKPSESGLIILGGVYNDLGEYEIDVEEGMDRPMNYHRFGRVFLPHSVGAHMFEDGFSSAKDILLEFLRSDEN